MGTQGQVKFTTPMQPGERTVWSLYTPAWQQKPLQKAVGYAPEWHAYAPKTDKFVRQTPKTNESGKTPNTVKSEPDTSSRKQASDHQITMDDVKNEPNWFKKAVKYWQLAHQENVKEEVAGYMKTSQQLSGF